MVHTITSVLYLKDNLIRVIEDMQYVKAYMSPIPLTPEVVNVLLSFRNYMRIEEQVNQEYMPGLTRSNILTPYSGIIWQKNWYEIHFKRTSDIGEDKIFIFMEDQVTTIKTEV